MCMCVCVCACVCVCMCVCVHVHVHVPVDVSFFPVLHIPPPQSYIFPPPQLFYYINGHMLNTIMLRREMCHWKYGPQIRSVTCLACLHGDVFYFCCPTPHSYNLSQLEEWCVKRGLAESGVLAEISPVHQTCKLLQMNKTNDVMEITSICPSLNPKQV